MPSVRLTAVAALSDAEAFIYIAPPLEEAPDAVTGSSAAKPEDQTVGQVLPCRKRRCVVSTGFIWCVL